MAVGTYTITGDVVPGREYSDDYGAKQVYMVALENAQAESDTGKFELHKKKDSKPPKAGDNLEVKRFQQGDFNGAKFTRIYLEFTEKPSSGSGSGGSAQGGGPGLEWQSAPYEKGAEHPRNEKRVIHTSALASTPAYIQQILEMPGVAEQPKTWDEYWKLVGKVATKLTRSYEAAIESQQRLPMGGGEVPADTDGLELQHVDNDKFPY